MIIYSSCSLEKENYLKIFHVAVQDTCTVVSDFCIGYLQFCLKLGPAYKESGYFDRATPTRTFYSWKRAVMIDFNAKKRLFTTSAA